MDAYDTSLMHCEDNGDGAGGREEDHNSNNLFWSDEVKIRLFLCVNISSMLGEKMRTAYKEHHPNPL